MSGRHLSVHLKVLRQSVLFLAPFCLIKLNQSLRSLDVTNLQKNMVELNHVSAILTPTYQSSVLFNGDPIQSLKI